MLKQSIAILAFTTTIALPLTIAAATALTPNPQPAKMIKSQGKQKIEPKMYSRSMEGVSRINAVNLKLSD
jgi:hypothetical protein